MADWYLCPGPAGPGGYSPHAAGGSGLQDEAGSADTGGLAGLCQRHLQRLLERLSTLAHARLSQVRLLPDHVSDWWPAAGGGPGAWRGFHG